MIRNCNWLPPPPTQPFWDSCLIQSIYIKGVCCTLYVLHCHKNLQSHSVVCCNMLMVDGCGCGCGCGYIYMIIVHKLCHMQISTSTHDIAGAVNYFIQWSVLSSCMYKKWLCILPSTVVSMTGQAAGLLTLTWLTNPGSRSTRLDRNNDTMAWCRAKPVWQGLYFHLICIESVKHQLLCWGCIRM